MCQRRQDFYSQRFSVYLLGILLTTLLVFMPVLASAAPSCPVPGTIRLYVQQGASGITGESWANALPTLQDALYLASSTFCPDSTIREIWVAAGIYYPDEGAGQEDNDRRASFQLRNELAVYGGFAGTEDALEDRDWETNLTILSGDIDQNDLIAGGVVTDSTQIVGQNSFHVVTSKGNDESAMLDGFTITGGKANGASTLGMGGGIFVTQGSPTFVNLTLRGNRAIDGGGLYSGEESSPKLTNIHFNSNGASRGGGMAVDASSPTLNSVFFHQNRAKHSGGGIHNRGSSIALVDGLITHNSAIDGGGIYNHTGMLTVTTSTVQENQALHAGGGIASSGIGSALLFKSHVISNNAELGGGLYGATRSEISVALSSVQGNSAHNGGGIWGVMVAVAFSTISANQAEEAGGGLYMGFEAVQIQDLSGSLDDTPGWGVLFLTKSTISGNSAQQGGAIFGPPQLSAGMTGVIQSTISANEAEEIGGISIGLSILPGLYIPSPILENSIFAQNTGGDCHIAIDNLGEVFVTPQEDSQYPVNVIIGDDSCSFFEEAMRGDPLLGPLADNGGPTLTHALLPNSMAIDAIPVDGNSCLYPAESTQTKDLLREDLEPVEVFGLDIQYDQRGKPRAQGLGCDIGAYEVEVQATGETSAPASTTSSQEENPPDTPPSLVGQCKIGEDFASIQAAVDAPECTSIFIPSGIYTESVLIGRNLTITGDSVDAPVVSSGGSGSVFVVQEEGRVSLAYLIITHGSGRERFRNSGTHGGGIVNEGSLTLSHIVLVDNQADVAGAIYNYGGHLLVSDSTIRSNKATAGGGIVTYYGQLTLRNSRIEQNSAEAGGGIYSEASDVLIDQSTIHANQAQVIGGGMRSLSSNVMIRNSTFSANSAASSGGAIDSEKEKVGIENSTLSGNEAKEGGAVFSYLGEVTVTHSTLYNNRAEEGGALFNRIATYTLGSSILVNNPEGNCGFYGGGMVDAGYNLIDDSTCGEFAVQEGDPLLGPLANNGGPTQTHTLQPGSPGIDAIPENESGCGKNPLRDQRGAARPQGAGCDIGAYEAAASE